ncbi:outer membrane beta-barrel protein [Helicobacter marmotae]|uniref:Outer membrane protein beta-barrel domain-containing protein n=1 Tax=Helicobacter marmotae TaxID=152490 RepID=A0A3D8I1L9_9HELI|nr:outer membrane beta-barrel protein [Helicobacter marmotae]RDU59028.1 hypothetical protein CQA63_08440 [Helicobacter marmotae]
MKKLLLSLLCAMSLSTHAFAVSVAGIEISPEIGLLAGKTQYKDTTYDANSSTNYGAFGRIWVGLFDLVIAPQFKYDYIKSSGAFDKDYTNLQYGVSAGYNIGLIVARLTPYIGVNYSSFNKYFKDTTSYNAGLKLKIDFIPISLGVLYTYQNPEFEVGGEKLKMHTIQALIGLHF